MHILGVGCYSFYRGMIEKWQLTLPLISLYMPNSNNILIHINANIMSYCLYYMIVFVCVI